MDQDLLAPMDFGDAKHVEVPVRIAGINYILREAGGGAGNTYKDAQMRCIKLNAKGEAIGQDGISETEALLVSLCLHETDGNGNVKMDGQTPVTVNKAVIRRFPYRIQKELFQRAEAISHLEGDSANVIRKRIAALQKRLEQLEGESGPKEPPNGSTGGSALEQSSDVTPGS